MMPTPSMMQFHNRHKEAHRRIVAAGMRTVAPKATPQPDPPPALQERRQELDLINAQLAAARRELARLEAARLDIEDANSRIRYPSKTLIDIVARAHGLSPAEIIANRRFRPITTARAHLSWLLATLRPDLSLPSIGKILGGRDHTTIMHACRRWENYHAAHHARQIAIVNEALGRTDDAS